MKIDRRLSQLGAKSIMDMDIGLGDDQHSSAFEGTLGPWLLSLWKSLNRTNPSLLPRIPDIIVPNLNNLGDAKVEVIYYSSDDAPQDSIVSDSKKLIRRARSMHPALKFHNDGEPQYMLKMVTNQRLTKKEPERDVRHFELEDPSSAVRYQVGDALEILPSQNPSAVNAFIKRCSLDPDCYISGGDEVSKGSPVNGLMDRIKLKTFVALTMDVASASPGRYFYEIMSYFATAQHEKECLHCFATTEDEKERLQKERLEEFASPEGRAALYQYNRKEGRTVLEVLEDFPWVHMPFEWLVQLTPSLKKRAFSISSSPLAHPNRIHLTVSVVSWLATPFRRKHGLCSTWLAGLDPNEGCAPFRALVEERAAQRAREPTAPILFFFGCRNEDDDFLYKDFWSHHAQDNRVLSPKEGGGFFVAFSRDQPEKVYVQHKIREQSARVLDMLCSGAAVYVAGSSIKMPADVRAALEVVREKGGDAGWLSKLERVGKYNIETWS